MPALCGALPPARPGTAPQVTRLSSPTPGRVRSASHGVPEGDPAGFGGLLAGAPGPEFYPARSTLRLQEVLPRSRHPAEPRWGSSRQPVHPPAGGQQQHRTAPTSRPRFVRGNLFSSTVRPVSISHASPRSLAATQTEPGSTQRIPKPLGRGPTDWNTARLLHIDRWPHHGGERRRRSRPSSPASHRHAGGMSQHLGVHRPPPGGLQQTHVGQAQSRYRYRTGARVPSIHGPGRYDCFPPGERGRIHVQADRRGASEAAKDGG